MPATNLAMKEMLSRDFLTAPSLPSHWHLCLSTGSMVENGDGAVKPSGNGYADIQIAPGVAWSKAENSTTSNVSAYSFPTATGDWGSVKAVFMSHDGGDIWFYQNLYPPIDVKNGTTLVFPAGSIVIKMRER